MYPYLKIAAIALVGVFAVIGMLFTGVFLAMQFDLLNVRGSIADRNDFFLDSGITLPGKPCTQEGAVSCSWTETPEWAVVKEGLTKDAAVIARVSTETGVSPRMIAAVVVPEQIRFFTSNREVFKRYFEPLKILGSLSQFSLGVSGIKQETARAIESYAADPHSPFYPGEGMSALLSYNGTTTERDTALYNRLTDAHDHYYSYLYTALFIKEITAQWERAGYDVSQTPEVVVTLFNIGFAKSNPNDSPAVAGASIATGGKVYSYGQLGTSFYRGSELTNIFPK